MSYCCDKNRAKVSGRSGKPLNDEDKTNKQDPNSPGTRLCSSNVIRLHDFCSQSALTSFNSSQAQVIMVKAENNKRIQIGKRKHVAYTAHKRVIQKRRDIREP